MQSSRLAPALKNAIHLPAGTRRRDGANASDFLLPEQACDPVNRAADCHNVAAGGAPRSRLVAVTAAANRPAKERAQPGEGQKREDHHRPTIRRNATGTVPLVGIGRKQRLRALMPAGPWHRVSSAAPYHIFTPCSAKYFSAPGCHGMGEFFID